MFTTTSITDAKDNKNPYALIEALQKQYAEINADIERAETDTHKYTVELKQLNSDSFTIEKKLERPSVPPIETTHRLKKELEASRTATNRSTEETKALIKRNKELQQEISALEVELNQTLRKAHQDEVITKEYIDTAYTHMQEANHHILQNQQRITAIKEETSKFCKDNEAELGQALVATIKKATTSTPLKHSAATVAPSLSQQVSQAPHKMVAPIQPATNITPASTHHEPSSRQSEKKEIISTALEIIEQLIPLNDQLPPNSESIKELSISVKQSLIDQGYISEEEKKQSLAFIKAKLQSIIAKTEQPLQTIHSMVLSQLPEVKLPPAVKTATPATPQKTVATKIEPAASTVSSSAAAKIMETSTSQASLSASSKKPSPSLLRIPDPIQLPKRTTLPKPARTLEKKPMILSSVLDTILLQIENIIKWEESGDIENGSVSFKILKDSALSNGYITTGEESKLQTPNQLKAKLESLRSSIEKEQKYPLPATPKQSTLTLRLPSLSVSTSSSFQALAETEDGPKNNVVKSLKKAPKSTPLTSTTLIQSDKENSNKRSIQESTEPEPQPVVITPPVITNLTEAIEHLSIEDIAKMLNTSLPSHDEVNNHLENIEKKSEEHQAYLNQCENFIFSTSNSRLPSALKTLIQHIGNDELKKISQENKKHSQKYKEDIVRALTKQEADVLSKYKKIKTALQSYLNPAPVEALADNQETETATGAKKKKKGKNPQETKENKLSDSTHKLIAALKTPNISFIQQAIKSLNEEKIIPNKRLILDALTSLKKQINRHQLKIAIDSTESNAHPLLQSEMEALKKCQAAYEAALSILTSDDKSSLALQKSSEDTIKALIDAIKNKNIPRIYANISILQEVDEEGLKVFLEFIETQVNINAQEIHALESKNIHIKEGIEALAKFKKDIAEKTGEEIYRFKLNLQRSLNNNFTLDDIEHTSPFLYMNPTYDLSVFETALHKVNSEHEKTHRKKEKEQISACLAHVAESIKLKNFSPSEIPSESKTFDDTSITPLMLKNRVLIGDIDYVNKNQSVLNPTEHKEFITLIAREKMRVRVVRTDINGRLEELRSQKQQFGNLIADNKKTDFILEKIKKTLFDCQTNFYLFALLKEATVNDRDLEGIMITLLERLDTLLINCLTFVPNDQNDPFIAPSPQPITIDLFASEIYTDNEVSSSFLKLRQATIEGDLVIFKQYILKDFLSDDMVDNLLQIVRKNIIYFESEQKYTNPASLREQEMIAEKLKIHNTMEKMLTSPAFRKKRTSLSQLQDRVKIGDMKYVNDNQKYLNPEENKQFIKFIEQEKKEVYEKIQEIGQVLLTLTMLINKGKKNDPMTILDIVNQSCEVYSLSLLPIRSTSREEVLAYTNEAMKELTKQQNLAEAQMNSLESLVSTSTSPFKKTEAKNSKELAAQIATQAATTSYPGVQTLFTHALTAVPQPPLGRTKKTKKNP